MTTQFLEGVAQIEKECFSQPWSVNMLSNELENPTARFFVALQDNRVIAYAGMYSVAGECSLANIGVSGRCRRCGIGKLLMEQLIETAESENADFLTLEVRKSNRAAIGLYEKLGFVCVGERRNYYSSPKEDAVLMTKYFQKDDEE